MASIDPNFPFSLIIDVPLPTPRLASSAKQALQVDAELSPLVQRTFSIVPSNDAADLILERRSVPTGLNTSPGNGSVLRTQYKATTNRMLRVAVNGFMESLGVILGVMEELDVDVLEAKNAR